MQPHRAIPLGGQTPLGPLHPPHSPTVPPDACAGPPSFGRREHGPLVFSGLILRQQVHHPRFPFPRTFAVSECQ